MNRNFYICATDLTVISGANPYKNINEIYLKYWKKHFPEDYQSILEYMKKKKKTVVREETYSQCIRRIAKENNIDIGKEVGECLLTKNTEQLTQNKLKVMEKIKDKLPEKSKKEFTESFNSLTNTQFGIRFENKGIELYQQETGNSVEIDRRYHKEVIFEVPSESVSSNCNDSNDNGIDMWHIGGKLDGISKDKDNTKFVLEIKNRVNNLFYKLRDYEKVQCYVYMYLLGIEKTHLVETLKSQENRKINIIEVIYEEKYWDFIMEKTMLFIEDFYDFILDKKRKIKLISQ
jgi:hypothetical protein